MVNFYTIKGIARSWRKTDEISCTTRWFYVPTDFDTKEKALSGAKAAEKGLK